MRWFYHMSALSAGQGDGDAGEGSSFETKDVGQVSRGQPTWYEKTFPCILLLVARNFQLSPFDHMPFLYLYSLHLYPGFYSYTEGATWKILDLLTENLLI